MRLAIVLIALLLAGCTTGRIELPCDAEDRPECFPIHSESDDGSGK